MLMYEESNNKKLKKVFWNYKQSQIASAAYMFFRNQYWFP